MLSRSVLSDCLQPHGLWPFSHSPLSMGFPRQEYWNALSFRTPGDLPSPGIEPMPLASPTLAERFLTMVSPGMPSYLPVTLLILLQLYWLSSSFSGFHCHFCKTGIIRPSLLTSQSCQKNEMKQLRHQNSELLKLSARGWFVGTFAAVKCCSDCPEYLSGGLTLGRQLCSLCHRKWRNKAVFAHTQPSGML